MAELDAPEPDGRPFNDRGAAARAAGSRGFAGVSSNGSIVNGMVSPAGDMIDAPDLDVPAGFNGLRGSGDSKRGGKASSSGGEKGSTGEKPAEADAPTAGKLGERGKESSDGGVERFPGWIGPPT